MTTLPANTSESCDAAKRGHTPVLVSDRNGVVRQTIFASGSLMIENSSLPANRPLGHGYSPNSQIVLPYHGAFSWQVGRTDWLIDANVVLFVTGGEEFLETHPVRSVGHGSAILTPSDAILDELFPLSKAFESVTRPMSDQARLTMHALMFDPGLEPLALEELAVNLLRTVLED